jgi:chromosome segregation ATPase
MPVSGPLPPPMPGRRREPGMVIALVVAGLLLVVGGVMTYLWLASASELTDTRADLNGQVEELNNTIATQNDELDRLGDELQTAQDALEDAQTNLEGSENQVDELEEQQDQLRECLTLVSEAQAASDAGDQEAADALLQESEPICDEAFNALFG